MLHSPAPPALARMPEEPRYLRRRHLVLSAPAPSARDGPSASALISSRWVGAGETRRRGTTRNAGFSGDSGQRPESSPRSRWQPVPSRPALALRPGLLRPERAPRRGSRREQSAWAGLPPPARPAAPRPRPASPARRPAVPPPAGCLRPLPRLHSSGQRQRLSMAGPVLRGAGGSGGRGLGRAGPSRPRPGAAGPGGRRCGGRAVCPHPGLPPPQPGACKLPRASWQGGSEAGPPRGM